MSVQESIQIHQDRPPFWRDERSIGLISEVVVVSAVVLVLLFMYRNMMAELSNQKDVAISYQFLWQTSGFDIGESLIDYDRASTYGRAIWVGILNTFQVAILGGILMTIVGVAIGIMRLSSNFLVSFLARIYIEAFRNIPLLILLIFWYQAIFLKLPRIKEAIIVPNPSYLSTAECAMGQSLVTDGPCGLFFLSSKGLAGIWGVPTETWGTFLWVLAGGVGLCVILAWILVQRGRVTGRMPLVSVWVVVTFLAVTTAGLIVLEPLSLSLPYLDGLRTQSGRVWSPEFIALLSALVVYTSAFVAENVRSGIQSVSKGQREAATALGLGPFQTLRLIIFPQAMRVIVPPLISQYLNLTKNSSLAVAIAYPDFFHVAANTTLNQTGRAIEIFVIVMAVYLSFSLSTSFFMNIYNRRIQIVER